MIHRLKKKHIYQPDKPVGLSLLTALIFCSFAAPAQNTIHTEDTGAAFSIRATHLLGFEHAKNNCTGTLTIQHDLLQFQQNDETPAHLKIASVRDVLLGEESKQVGGTPMALAKLLLPSAAVESSALSPIRSTTPSL